MDIVEAKKRVDQLEMDLVFINDRVSPSIYKLLNYKD